MRRRNRDIPIFGMAALDLFASAMGAFILISIVMFPYFPNIGSADQRDLDAALGRLQQAEENNDALRAALRQARRDAEAARRDAEAAQRRLEDVTLPHLDLVIALDVTPSMGREITGLTTELTQLIHILTTLAPSVAVGIVAFTDRCAGAPLRVLELTAVSGPATRLTDFVRGLRPTRPPCDSDNPEAFLAALRTATRAGWRPRAEERRVVMITDNPAYPDEVENAVATARSFAGAGGGRSVSTVHVSTENAEPNTGAFLARVAAAGRGEAVAAGGSMTANLLQTML